MATTACLVAGRVGRSWPQLESEIQVPLTKAGIQYLESGIHGLGSRIQDFFGFLTLGDIFFFRIDFSTEEVLFSFIHRR